MKTIDIFSSNGFLSVNAETGEVVECTLYHGGEGIDKITKFDLEEWRRTYPDETCEGGDILDFGFWNADGSYDPPVEDWRKEFREEIKRGGLFSFGGTE